MNEHDDLERTVARSLRQRTERVATSVPDLDGVWAYVDRRRNRRRHVAVVGSLAVVAVGAIGFASIGRGDPDRIPAPAAAPDLQAAWRCTNQLDYFEEGSAAVFFATCEPTEVDATAPVFDLTTPTTAADVVETTALPYPTTTTIVCLAPNSVPTPTTPVDAVATTVPCGLWKPPPTTVVESMVDDTVIFSTTTSVVPLSPLEQSYRIQAGDSLVSVAERFGITLEQLVNYNEFPERTNHVLFAGDDVLIPPGAIIPDVPPIPTTTTSVP